MPRSACAPRICGSGSALPVAMKGGVLCRPTIVTSVQQPGRSDPGVRAQSCPGRCLGVAHAPVAWQEIADGSAAFAPPIARDMRGDIAGAEER